MRRYINYSPAESGGCGCSEIPDNCLPVPLIPVCDNPEFCEEINYDKCILHKGDPLLNLEVIEGTKLDTILKTIDTKLGNEALALQIISLIQTNTDLQNAILAIVNS